MTRKSPIGPLERRIYALTYEELEALRRLQEGSLASLGLVWLDTAATLPTVVLTSAGRGYATE